MGGWAEVAACSGPDEAALYVLLQWQTERREAAWLLAELWVPMRGGRRYLDRMGDTCTVTIMDLGCIKALTQIAGGWVACSIFSTFINVFASIFLACCILHARHDLLEK